jgi:hypothetical protein
MSKMGILESIKIIYNTYINIYLFRNGRELQSFFHYRKFRIVYGQKFSIRVDHPKRYLIFPLLDLIQSINIIKERESPVHAIFYFKSDADRAKVFDELHEKNLDKYIDLKLKISSTVPTVNSKGFNVLDM